MKKKYMQPEVQAYKMVMSQMVLTSTMTLIIQSTNYDESNMDDL